MLCSVFTILSKFWAFLFLSFRHKKQLRISRRTPNSLHICFCFVDKFILFLYLLFYLYTSLILLIFIQWCGPSITSSISINSKKSNFPINKPCLLITFWALRKLFETCNKTRVEFCKFGWPEIRQCVTVRTLAGVSCCCLRFFEDISLWRVQSVSVVWCYSSPPMLLKYLVQRKGNGCCDIYYCRSLACKYALKSYNPGTVSRPCPIPFPRPKGPAGLPFRHSWDEVITLKTNAFPSGLSGMKFSTPLIFKL